MQSLIICQFYLLPHLVNSQQGVNQEYDEKLLEFSAKSKQYYYSNKDSTYHYLNKISNLTRKYNLWHDHYYNLVNWNSQAGYFYDLNQLKTNIRKLDSIFLVHTKIIDTISDRSRLKNFLFYDKGNYHFKTNDFRNSRKAFLSIIKSIEPMPDSLMTAYDKHFLSVSYSFIAKMYSNEGKYDLAEQFYKKNIRFISIKNPNDKSGFVRNNSLLAEVYKRQKKHQISNIYFLKSFWSGIKNKGSINSIITDGHHIVQNHLSLTQIDSAEYYLSFIENKLPKDHPFWYKHHKIKAELFKASNKYEMSSTEYLKALEKLKLKWGNKKNEEVAEVQNDIGNLNVKFKKYSNAIKAYNLGLQNSNIESEKITLLKILKNKSIALNKIKSQESYNSCIETVDLGVRKLNALKPYFESTDDKLFLMEDAFPIFESGMEAAKQLHNSSDNEEYIDKAFDYAEKSKSVLLLEALLATKATHFSNIPDNLLEQERQLKSEITFIEKQLNQAKEADNEKEDQLFYLQEEHRRLINKIETKYKTYYDLKYNTKTLNVSDTQKLLNHDEKLISYFYGNEAIYAITVDKTSKQFERIPIDAALENTIKQVHKMLGNSKSDITTLSKSSYTLYKNLVAPFITSTEKKKLIIIPDGLLNYIPFGALNTEKNGLSYLMESHAIRYANSATLYAQLKNRDKKKGDLLAFAPKFSGEQVQIDPSRDKLLPLPHNKREVEQILNSFKGQSYINENASLQNFTSQLSNYGMLHLATHAVFDDTAPEYSYLAFSNTDNQENLLYVSDLYNLQINADLVTLSACETGVGELKRGEGFLSLARGFFYSGASSIASTLWKVNDASTATLMNSFYKNLSDGDSKDVALQKSQISFLESNRQNGLSHPYYWSGFIISGNTEPLTSPDYWTWIGLGILLFAVVGFLVFGRKIKS